MRQKRGSIFGPILFLILFVAVQQAWACTIFSVDGTSTNYFASNEDWTFTDPAIQVVPGDGRNYSYMVFGWDSYLPQYPQGGVNQHGVCLDWALVSQQRAINNKSGRKQPEEDIMYLILKQCKNVEEVIQLVGRYNWSQFATEHLLVADKFGDSCVIEWKDNDYVFIRKSRNYQVITNFYLSDTKIGWYPCYRFDRAERLLGSLENKTATFNEVKSALQKTHQRGQNPTVYSYIVDTKSLEITVFMFHDFTKGKTFNFSKEIAKGEHRIKLYTM